ncbi:MAG: DUF1722 domain-containing protein [Halobacteria archaeon]|nr:DUF1722 domain-containing protein [Halobacteria archaeon]
MHKIKIGVSSCLMGEEVRYDGGHKRNIYLTGTLTRYFDFKPICPEAAIGMGIPRPPIRLVESEFGIQAVGVKDLSLNVTDKLREFSQQMVGRLQDISGYILKKDSPSCGMVRVRVFNHKDMPEKRGRGIFADTLLTAMPSLPVEEEGRLMDPVLRENFIERVFIYYRWQQLIRSGLTVNNLVEFHTQHKFNLLAHDETTYRQLGRMIAEINKGNLQAVANNYLDILMTGLKKPASRKRHTNVLMHIMGFFKNQLSGDDKQEMLDLLDAYRLGQLPLIVPITMLKHHLRRFPHPYVEQQYYMNPYPEELMLRNSL